jgi:hypothetical protein
MVLKYFTIKKLILVKSMQRRDGIDNVSGGIVTSILRIGVGKKIPFIIGIGKVVVSIVLVTSPNIPSYSM